MLANPSSDLRAGRRLARLGLIVGLTLAASLYPVCAEERCGWLENPTPGNWWLKDSHGLWIISAQGGPYAEGIEKLPEPQPDRFVATNGQYGYSCVCLTGAFDVHAQTMTRVEVARTSPLSVCRNDKALPAP
jgi:hypothetical protein